MFGLNPSEGRGTGNRCKLPTHMRGAQPLSRVWLFATPRTLARQTPPSMGFSRQEYWSGLPCPPPGDPPNPGTEPGSPALQADSLLPEPPGQPPKHTRPPAGALYRRPLPPPLLHPTHTQTPGDAWAPALRGLTCRSSWSRWPWRCAQGASSPARGSAARRGAGPPVRSPAGTAPAAGQAGRGGRPASRLRPAGAQLGEREGEAHQRPTDPATTPCPRPAPLGAAENLQVTSHSRACPLLNYCLQGNLQTTG